MPFSAVATLHVDLADHIQDKSNNFSGVTPMFFIKYQGHHFFTFGPRRAARAARAWR
jgi:hypothetical protein